MKRKIFTVILALIIMVTTLTNAYAANNFFNVEAFETAYKLSNESDIDLPFINVFNKGATYDEIVKHSGISIGESTIDIDEKLEGVHFIMSNDMVTIKGEVEHGIIYGTNVVIEGKISEDSVIIADSVKILDEAIVERDLIIVSNELELTGLVKGNLIGSVGNTTINGKVEKDLRIDTSSVSIENAILEGDIYLTVPEGTANIEEITSRYPNAVIQEKVQATEKKLDGEEIANNIFNGAKVVIIYTIIGVLITRKENNIVKKASARFTENLSFGIISGAAMFMLSIAVIILLFMLAVFGLGIVAWPILIVYLAIILFSISISSFVVGMTIYDILKKKINKYKIPVLIGIFTIIYALTQISVISYYVLLTINLMSMAIIMSYIFKREEYGEEIVEAKVVNNTKNK